MTSFLEMASDPFAKNGSDLLSPVLEAEQFPTYEREQATRAEYKESDDQFICPLLAC